RQVDHARLGTDARDHPMAHADEIVKQAVIGEERDYRVRHAIMFVCSRTTPAARASRTRCVRSLRSWGSTSNAPWKMSTSTILPTTWAWTRARRANGPRTPAAGCAP